MKVTQFGLIEGAAAATPPSGVVTIYAKTDNLLYWKDDTGLEQVFGSGGAGTVTSVSVVTANGVSGSVANPTSTPAITITLAAITPTTVTPSGLVDISGASAGQIKFPATQNPSSNVNTLDDYEEGTWTPTDNSGPGFTFASGVYTKIGNLVTAMCYITYASTADGTGVQIAGLPFTVGSADSCNQGFITLSDETLARYVFPSPSTTVFTIATSAGVTLTNAQMSLNYIYCTLIYQV